MSIVESSHFVKLYIKTPPFCGGFVKLMSMFTTRLFVRLRSTLRLSTT